MFGDAATEIEVDILEYVSNVGVILFFFFLNPPLHKFLQTSLEILLLLHVTNQRRRTPQHISSTFVAPAAGIPARGQTSSEFGPLCLRNNQFLSSASSDDPQADYLAGCLGRALLESPGS